MAKVGTLDARLARLQEQIRKAKEATSAVKRRKRAALRDNEKRRVWIVGTCAMAAMGERRMRELIARELRKEGVLRKEGDAELFADLLAASLRADGGGDRGAARDGRAGEPGRRRGRPGRGRVIRASAARPWACRRPRRTAGR